MWLVALFASHFEPLGSSILAAEFKSKALGSPKTWSLRENSNLCNRAYGARRQTRWTEGLAPASGLEPEKLPSEGSVIIHFTTQTLAGLEGVEPSLRGS